MPNGIDLILADHQAVDELLAAFAETQDGSLVGQVIDLLAAHDDAEQAALYPFAMAVLGNTAVLKRSLAAHSAVKQQIDEVKVLEGAPLVVAVTALGKLVKNHARDEEKNLLPALADKADAAQLDTLGARILQAKQRGG
jgi:hemerythrin superfamily protein